jgi:cysteine-rich repeat protein
MSRRSSLVLVVLLVSGCGRIGFAANAQSDASMDASVDGHADTGRLPPAAVCGDGMLSGDEVCDDGNTVSGDGCSAACDAREICGDGVVSGEECDDGNGVNGDGCDNDCTLSCRDELDCDDALSCNGFETCGDDAVCAVGVPLPDGSDCGDARVCRGGSCASVNCGDLTVDADEECDDGNLVDGDGCDNDCTFSCVVDADCDDGNDCTTTGCTAAHVCELTSTAASGTTCERDGLVETVDVCLGGMCLRSICGDGFVDAALDEECDDSNTINGDGCEADCTFTCASDVECDDGETCNGEERCNPGTHVCERGTSLADGTRCGSDGGSCASGRCVLIMPVDGAVPFDSASGTDSSTGACPAVPDPEMPLECFKVCASDADCVYATSTSSCCCSCASGGTSEPINRATSGAWNIRVSRVCGPCGGVSCLDVDLCGGPPVCLSQRCSQGGTG